MISTPSKDIPICGLIVSVNSDYTLGILAKTYLFGVNNSSQVSAAIQVS